MFCIDRVKWLLKTKLKRSLKIVSLKGLQICSKGLFLQTFLDIPCYGVGTLIKYK